MSPGPTSRLPAIFFGHGSPMNALQDNAYARAWQHFGATIPKPKAILAISAHWYTRGTSVTAMAAPRTIHDFGGFPRALFDVRYPAPGDSQLAARPRAAATDRGTNGSFMGSRPRNLVVLLTAGEA